MKKDNLKLNFIYNFSYQLLSFIIPLITTPYVSRVLGATGIGRYSYSHSIAYYFVMFIMLGINNYGNRSVAFLKKDRNKLSVFVCNAIFLKFLIGIVLTLIYVMFCINSEDFINYIMIIYVVSAIFDISWFFFGLEEFKLTVIRNTIFKIVATLSIFIFVKKTSDIYLYTLIMVGEIFLSQLYLWKYLRKYIDFIKPSSNELLKQIKPNFVLFVPVIAVSLYKMMDKTMLGYFCGTTEVGLYESSNKLMAIPVGFIVALGTVMLPRISSLRSTDNSKQIHHYFNTAIIFAISISSLISFGIISVSREFVPLYFGDGFEKCIYLLYILLPACIFQSIANVVRTQYLIPYNEDNIYIKSVILGAIINLIINSSLIFYFQSIGTAIGTLIAEFVVCFYQCLKIRDKINLVYPLRISFPSVVCALLMAILLVNINLEGFILMQIAKKICIGAIFYFVSMSICYHKYIIQFIKKRRQ